MSGVMKFFVTALGGALELGLATPDDVLKHITPEVLAQYLPRAQWGKLLTACLAAPKVDAKLVVDTIGVADLCANVPGSFLWNLITDVAMRALGRGLVAAPPPSIVGADEPRRGSPASRSGPLFPRGSSPSSAPLMTASPKTAVAAPAPAPAQAPRGPTTPVLGVPVVASGTPPAGSSLPPERSDVPDPAPTIAAAPRSDVIDIVFDDDEPAPLGAPPVSHRAETVPGGQAQPRSRSSTGAGASSRRPQASARSDKRTTPPPPRRGPPANSDFDLDTDVGSTQARSSVEVEVDDDQLVDWSAAEETVTSDVDTRKR